MRNVLDCIDENTAQQFILNGKKGEFISANTYNLDGGYSGNAVEFNPTSGVTHQVKFPGDYDFGDTTGKYFTMWFALRSKDGPKISALKSGEATYGFRTGGEASNRVFVQIYSYVSNGVSGRVLFSASSVYKENTWYQIYVPLADMVTAFANTSSKNSIHLFDMNQNTTEIEDSANFTILIGDLGFLNYLSRKITY